jgi:hypothetical protein
MCGAQASCQAFLAAWSNDGMEEVRRIVGVELTDGEAEALATYYANLADGVAAFPADDLKRTEPPLRSIPGPVL